MVITGLSLGAMLFDLSEENISRVDNAIMICSNGIVAAQALSSFYLFGKNLRQVCMKRNKGKVGINDEEHGFKVEKEIQAFELISNKNLYVGPNNSYLPDDREYIARGFRNFNEMKASRLE